MATDMDKILTRIKTGKWNYIYFIGIGLCGFLTASNVLGGTFLAPNIDHVCSPPDEVNALNASKCSYYVKTGNESGETKVKCSSWDYVNDTFASTITSDFDLVCENDYWRATYQTVYMIGNFFGSPLNGVLSDKLGRRTTVTVGTIVFVVSSVLTAWLPNFTALLSLRFILGLMHPAVLQTGYVLCMEICEPKHRSTVGILISLPWALGTIWWGVLGYLLRDWHQLQIAASLPGIIILFFLWFFNESPRWLIIKGRFDEAYEVLKKAAKLNNSSIPEKDKLMDMMRGIKEAADEKKKAGDDLETRQEPVCGRVKSTLLQTVVLFRTPEIRKRTLLMYVKFIVASTVYYGLSLNGKNFSADPHVYMMLTGLMEVPAYTLTAPIVAKLGRRIPTSFCYTLCGVTILVLAFIPPEPTWLIISMAMVGKLCISAAYQIIYLISSEIFPTEVRLQGLGTSNLVARTGAVTSPFITDLLGGHYPWAPSMLFGCGSIVAGVTTLLLPETLNRTLPETIHQLETEKQNPKTNNEKENGILATEEEMTTLAPHPPLDPNSA